jgi:hypothetical protein
VAGFTTLYPLSPVALDEDVRRAVHEREPRTVSLQFRYLYLPSPLGSAGGTRMPVYQRPGTTRLLSMGVVSLFTEMSVAGPPQRPASGLRMAVYQTPTARAIRARRTPQDVNWPTSGASISYPVLGLGGYGGMHFCQHL